MLQWRVGRSSSFRTSATSEKLSRVGRRAVKGTDFVSIGEKCVLATRRPEKTAEFDKLTQK
jgi:hypothetical protein